MRILFKKGEEAYTGGEKTPPSPDEVTGEKDAYASAVKRAEGFQPRRKLAEAPEDQ